MLIVLKCNNCHKTIVGPKIVVNKNKLPGEERYWCKECVYFSEMKRINPETGT